MAQQRRAPIAIVNVVVDESKGKQSSPVSLGLQWTSPTVFTLNDTHGATCATIAFRRKIKRNFCLAAIRYFFDYVKVEQVAWPRTIVYKPKTTWGEPMTMMDAHVKINTTSDGQTHMGQNPYSGTIQMFIENEDTKLRFTIPLSSRTTQYKCLPPMFKKKHHSFLHIDIDWQLIVDYQDDFQHALEFELTSANDDASGLHAAKQSSIKERITDPPIYVHNGAYQPNTSVISLYNFDCSLRRVGSTENSLIRIETPHDHELLAVIVFRRKLTESDKSIESIREQFDYIKFGRKAWKDPVEPETKEWYEAFRQEDGVQLEMTHEKSPPTVSINGQINRESLADILKLRIIYATKIFQLSDGLWKFTIYIDVNMSSLISN